MGQCGCSEGDANDANDDDDDSTDDYADAADSDGDDDQSTNKSYYWLKMEYSCDSKFVPYYNYMYLD